MEGKLWYTDGKEKIKERAYVRTWPNYDTWLDVAQANDFLENKLGGDKSRFVRT